MPHLRTPLLPLLLGITIGLAAGESWPAYGGPGGRCASLPFTGPMVTTWVDARVAWQSDVPIPNGMAGDGRKPLVEGTPFVSGGYGSPILVGDRVYLQYYVPAGEPDAAMVAKQGEAFRSKFLLEADDVVHCFDAATGATVWRTVYEKSSLNYQSFTKGGPSLTCAYGDGRIYILTPGCRVFALDAATGDKFWEYRTPRFEREEALRAEVLAHGHLAGFNRDFTSSPRLVDGTLVINDHLKSKVMPPDGGETRFHYNLPSNLIGLDPATGAERWRLAGGLANGAQILTWTADDRTWLIAPGETGVQCLDPRTGKTCWPEAVGDAGRAMVTDGILVTGGGEKKDRHLLGYRLTPDGAQPAWKLTGHGRPGHLAVDRGHLYFDNRKGALVCVALATGRVVATAPSTQESHFGCYPVVMGSRLICAGSDSNQLHLYSADPADFRLLDDARIVHAWGYTTPILPALADGRMYLRTHDHLVCYDLRAEDVVKKLALRFPLPQGLVDDTGTYACELRLRDGQLSGGLALDAKRSLYLGTDDLVWGDNGLKGSLRIQTPTGGDEPFTVKATLTGNALTGTIAPQVAPFPEPLPLAGTISIVKREPWMPACSHVLKLDAASRSRDGTAKHLYLFATVKDGAVTALKGIADHTVKSWPVVRGEFTVDGALLSGSVKVLYRPDQWTTPLVAGGSCAAAIYALQVDLTKQDAAGSFTGTWGIPWDDGREFAGTLVDR